MTLENIELEFSSTMTEQEEISRCVRNLILTPAGTIPLNRDFGLDNSFLGLPIEAAKNILAVEIMEKVAKYEPRVTVTTVDMTADADGGITVKVVMTNG